MRPTVFRLALLVAGPLLAFGEASADRSPIDFNRDIRPILYGRCVTCHGPDEQERAAGLRLDTREGAHEDLGGYAAVEPGDPEASELFLRVTSDDPDMRMPPAESGPPLSESETDLLRRWIRQGGHYARHWSYAPPRKAALPDVVQKDWPAGAIDHFILARLESEGLKPAPRADRLTLARRLALDLTGLPPTWQQAQAFARDDSRTAYEDYVDSLIASPAFGERWARVWLDLARYADSAGYADDPPRTIWAYRDYVIDAINRNLPFDQFTVEQIAGDLLPDPSDRQLVATAFHRNTLTNNEGGTNDEEFRNVAVVDRVNTTMAVWMGTTMACAQCHTHKYDPITHDEYFQFFDFFNQSQDTDKRDERPTLDVWSDRQKELKRQWQMRLAELEHQLQAPSAEVDAAFDTWLAKISGPSDWQRPDLRSVDAQRETEIDDQGWVHLDSEPGPAHDRIAVDIATGGDALTGIRIETGRSQKRNFVISQVRATWIPETPEPQSGRFVRVTLPGKSRKLHLAEIQIFHDGDNIAPEGNASQSSTYRDAVASRVNDGNTDGNYDGGSVQHTAGGADPWVEIDLGSERPIDQLVIWNRTDGGEGIRKRLDGFSLAVLDDQRNVVWSRQTEGPAESKHRFTLDGKRSLDFAAAAADFEQSGFPASSVIDGKGAAERGWAISPQIGERHELLLAFGQPTPQRPGTLRVIVEQQSKHHHHLLDEFTIHTTTDRQVRERLELPSDIRRLIAVDADRRDPGDPVRLKDFFRTIAPPLQPVRDEIASLNKRITEMKPQTTVPVMAELTEEKRRETQVQIRGNYQSTGASVTAGTPAAFHPLSYQGERPTRLDLARWLIDPANPLTPRVIVNRHWEQLFGVGIVETSEEFGSQGELPSHPKLLDWLAVDFRDHGWDVKRLIKQIVMSSAYRQSSHVDPDKLAADPSNRLVSRGPRFRVSAEMVRDQALFVAGLLSHKKFGPPVNPPQPELGLKAAFGSATDWKTSGGEDRYRRGIYTTWRRSSPYPSMAQFDAPNREVCTVRRIRTNTPLQALVTLNDPVYVEAAQGLARRVLQPAGLSDQDRVRRIFRLALIRDPSSQEAQRILSFVRAATDRYRGTPEQAQAMATEPIGPLPNDADAAEYAAWTVVGNVILNLDEMLMKR